VARDDSERPEGGTRRTSRIPSLDGMRGMCISLVILSHLGGTAGFLHIPKRYSFGKLGVAIFFVVSGFLITTLLLQERAKTGTVSLRNFYLRRAIRLFPALYVFIGVVLAFQALGIVNLLDGDALAAATHTMNFHAHREWWLGHTWSLSFQEQFYLMWPAAIAFLGVAGGLRVALGAVLAAPLLRVAFFYGWPEQRALVDQAFPAIFDGPATGCLLALLRERLWQDPRYRGLLESPFVVVVPVIVVATYLYTPFVGIELLIGLSVMNVGIAMCIDWVMRFPDSPVGRVLNSRPVKWVGAISYSLYLWQQIFLCRSHVAWYTSFPFNLLLALAAATLSYHAVERQGMRLSSWILRAFSRRGREVPS
jgi:peptidoglycan/LPS O-acetylase OafA/YrhL